MSYQNLEASKKIRISGQHMNVGESLTSHIEKSIDTTVQKHASFRQDHDVHYDGNVTLLKSRNGSYSADCLIHLDSGVIIQSSFESNDPHLAFDGSLNRLEKRLRRYKERRLAGRRKNNIEKLDLYNAHHVMHPAEEEHDEYEDIELKEFVPVTIAENLLAVSTMTVAEAICELDYVDNPVLIFKNASSGQINIVYRRSDNNIGWVDPSQLKAK